MKPLLSETLKKVHAKAVERQRLDEQAEALVRLAVETDAHAAGYAEGAEMFGKIGEGCLAAAERGEDHYVIDLYHLFRMTYHEATSTGRVKISKNYSNRHEMYFNGGLMTRLEELCQENCLDANINTASFDKHKERQLELYVKW